jgi:hypothetical protein
VESHTRRRLSAVLIAAMLGAIAGSGIASASAGPSEQTGVFALLGGSPKILSKFWAEHAAGLSATLTIRQFALDGKRPVLNYDTDMQKLMHLVVVRDDFATFAHLHPAFDAATGIFWQPFTKDPNHRYYIYADTTPHGIGQQVFRFTLESDGTVAPIHPPSTASAPAAADGPYEVTLNRTTLPANRPKNVNLTILEDGRPAQDLGTYLGAAAHAVFINTSTLEYVHLHPMVRGAAGANQGAEMDMGGSAGPFLQMRTPALPPGTYKLWVQFSDANGKVYTVAFTMLAR